MPRGLSQERAQRIWDAAYGAAFVAESMRQPPQHYSDEKDPDDEATRRRGFVADQAAERASEAVTALRSRERHQPKGRR